MRFLMREQAYEKPLAAGALVYEQAEEVVETWRLNAALDGYRLFRIDLDERPATGRSLLFQFILNGDGWVENLRFRLFGPAERVRGQVLVEEEEVTVTREVGRERFETVLAGERRRPIVFVPTAAGLSRLRPWAGAGPLEAVVLDVTPLRREAPPPADSFAPRPVTLTCTYDAEGDGGRLTARWQAAETNEVFEAALVLSGPHGAVIAAALPGGLTATARRAIDYRPAHKIDK